MDNHSIDFLLNIEEVNKIVSIFQNEKAEIRLVGGCVRNALLNKNYKDIGCAVNIHPNDTTKILQKRSSFKVENKIMSIKEILLRRI